jgi:hypothetical protein
MVSGFSTGGIMKIKMIIENSGDSSVGINGFTGEVDLKVNVDIEDDFKEEFIEDFKKYLKIWFEFETKCYVYTEKEYEDEIEVDALIWSVGWND